MIQRPPWMSEEAWEVLRIGDMYALEELVKPRSMLMGPLMAWRRTGQVLAPRPDRPEDLTVPAGHFEATQVALDRLRELGEETIADRRPSW